MTITVHSKFSDEVLASGDKGTTARPLEGNWYFDPESVNMDNLVVTERTYVCPYKGMCFWIDLVEGDQTARNIAWVYRDPHKDYTFIKDRIGFYTRETSGTKTVEDESTAV